MALKLPPSRFGYDLTLLKLALSMQNMGKPSLIITLVSFAIFSKKKDVALTTHISPKPLLPLL